MTGISFPTFAIEGREQPLTVRYSLLAQVIMGRTGLDTMKLSEATSQANPERQQNWLKIFRAMVAENYLPDNAAANPKFTLDMLDIPSVDYFALVIGPDRYSDLTETCNEAIKKVAEAVTKRAKPAPVEKAVA